MLVTGSRLAAAGDSIYGIFCSQVCPSFLLQPWLVWVSRRPRLTPLLPLRGGFCSVVLPLGGWCCYAGLLRSRWSTWSRLGLVCPGSASCLSSEAPAQLCELGAWSLLLFLLLTCSLPGLQLLALRLGFHSVGLRSCLWRGKLPCLLSALVRLSSGTSCWPRCTLLVFSSDLALPQVGGRSR